MVTRRTFISTLAAGLLAAPVAADAEGDAPLVITGGTLFDGTGRAPLPDAEIVIRDGRIVSVTTAGTGVALAHGQRLDGRGTWIVPGFVDMHVHYYDWMGPPFLRHGVTTVREVGSNLERILELRRQSRASDAAGPRIFACGPLIDGPAPRHGPYISVSVTTEEEARDTARRLLARGVDCLKVYEQLTPRLVQAIAQEAQRAGVPVTAHLRDTTAVAALEAGVKGLEHATGFEPCDERAGAEVSRLIIERGAYVVPTLAVIDRAGLRLACRKRFVSRLRNLGGRVVAGSDTANLRPFPGAFLHRELELLVEAGLSPREALMAATSAAAEALGQGGNLGTIEPGKSADLVVLEGNPLQSISEIRRIAHVVREGRVVWTSPSTTTGGASGGDTRRRAECCT